MKISIALLIVLTLSVVGCASNSEVELPDWQIAERDKSHVALDPVELPLLCAVDIEDGRAWISVDCLDVLDAYEDIAEGNTKLAELNTSALRKTEGAYDSLVEAGKLQQQLVQIRQDLLEQEQREHMLDVWFYRALITLGLIGVAL